MADIRVERKRGSRTWIWILLVVVALIAAALLLDRAGYIDLPINTGGTDTTGDTIVSALSPAAQHFVTPFTEVSA